MTDNLLPPVRRGDLLLLRDEDYLFGQGELVLRVVTVHEVRQFRRKPWIFLGGLELRADGNARRRRDVLVKAEAIRTRRRRGV
jgi:hypothetical protein